MQIAEGESRDTYIGHIEEGMLVGKRVDASGMVSYMKAVTWELKCYKRDIRLSITWCGRSVSEVYLNRRMAVVRDVGRHTGTAYNGAQTKA